MKLVFFGNPKFASDSLEYLLKNKHKIELVITNPDKKSGRGLNYQETEVKKTAKIYKCNIYETDNLNANLIDELEIINPDIAVVVGYRFLPKKIYSIPKIATINLHASLLPKHTGASPIQYTLINGDKVAGLTTFIINEKIDRGNIVLQDKININDRITFIELYSKLSMMGGKLLVDSLNLLSNNKTFKKQDCSKRTFAKKITKLDFKINWNDTAYNIHNKIRALNYKGAYGIFNHKRIKFFETYYNQVNKNNMHNGMFYFDENMLFIKTQEGELIVKMVQLEGKKIINSKNFYNSINQKNNLFQ